MDHLLNDPKFEKKLVDIASQEGMSFMEARGQAEIYLKELYTEQNEIFSTLGVQLFEYILSRGYDHTIDVDSQELKKLAQLMRRHPVAFVMTHKTYIDMAVLAVVLGQYGLPIPHIFAGINMAFMGLGELGRNTGVIFIRRSFKDNNIYKATLRHYIAQIIQKKEHFMWAIEGTRSRTGKLVWPKMGILKYIVEGEREVYKEVKYVPVSVVYDLIPDVKAMTLEGRGLDKSPESLFWFLNYLRDLGGKFGKISLRFGEPADLETDKSIELPVDDSYRDPKAAQLPKLAFDLVHGINKITPVTTTSLICSTLLSKFSATKHQIEEDVIQLMTLIESHKSDALIDRGTPVNLSVQRGLNLLIKAKLLRQVGEGIKAKYAVIAENYLPVTYYANMAVHHFYHRAFIELALIKVADKRKDRYKAFWEEVMALRELFKFEFFYSKKARFSDEIENDLDILNPEWRTKLEGSKKDVLELLKEQSILISQVVLFPYIEAYRVVVKAVQERDPYEEYTDASLLNQCLFLGEEMNWQGLIQRLDSVSKPFLQNGIRLVNYRKLIPTAANNKEKEILSLSHQLDDLGDRIRLLQKFIINRPKPVNGVIPLERNIVPGSRTAGVTAAVIEGESGSHIAAFFDLDRTLIKGFSAKEFFQARLLSGKMTREEIISQFSGVLVYATGNKNFAGLAAIAAQGVKGVDEKVFFEVGEEVYLKYLADAIYPESRALVAAHLAKGHKVSIVSAATPYQVYPIARDLDIQDIMCTRMEVVKGKFTGEIIEPACWGKGKAIQAKAYAKENNIDLAKSFFYTDSMTDLPLLDMVGNPRPINPDRELTAVSFQRDWEIHRFDEAKKTGFSNVVNTGLVVGSLVPAILGGVASGFMSGSTREGVNSAMSLIGDLGCAMAGIKLVVKGEKNLESKRPAVFIFNHQSSADFFIMAKILRHDAVGIAKKELEKTPIGPLFKLSGAIFIDRKNRKKAIEAMRPAIEGLKTGTSIVIAPEGTRSKDYKLGEFKKGGFHLAMTAGVPIVPVVILNAHDAMPKGAKLFRPSVVEVEVLEPIPTKGWNKRNLEKNIEKIRDAYLEVLHQ
ncbi:MAG: HAD-IB family hydrolase [Bacteroidia bacterium]|nr:HAD-IB family hydrolase [Bacteroidia bacterium]